MFTSLLKDVVKDTDEQPVEEIHRLRFGRVPKAGASICVELGCVTLLMWMSSPTEKLSKPHAIGIFMEASSCRHG